MNRFEHLTWGRALAFALFVAAYLAILALVFVPRGHFLTTGALHDPGAVRSSAVSGPQ